MEIDAKEYLEQCKEYVLLKNDILRAIFIIERLAAQQAMQDDWYVEPLNELKERWK